MTDDEASSADMTAAAQRLNSEFAAYRRAHLNRTAEDVFASHANQPIAEVLIALMARANTPVHDVTAEALVDAANAISLGRRFKFV